MEEYKKIPGGKEVIDSLKLLGRLGIEEKMQVADLGCGRRGYFSLQAAKLVGDLGRVYAVDVVQSALENVQSMANLFGVNNLKVIWANLEILGATKIPDQSIDLALINNVFFQTDKDDLILKEATRILKANGKLLVTEWKRTKTLFGPPLEKRVSSEEIKNNAKNCGLSLLEEFDAGPYHYALIFKK